MSFPNISNADQLAIDLEEKAESYDMAVELRAVSALANISDITPVITPFSYYRFNSTMYPNECILFFDIFVVVSVFYAFYIYYIFWLILNEFSFRYRYIHVVSVSMHIFVTLLGESYCELFYSRPDPVPISKFWPVSLIKSNFHIIQFERFTVGLLHIFFDLFIRRDLAAEEFSNRKVLYLSFILYTLMFFRHAEW